MSTLNPLVMSGFALVALFASGTASAATLKVPKQFATIQEAVDAAVAGDVIQVAKGTYSENVTITKTDLEIVGKSGAIVDGGDTGVGLTITASTGLIVKGLTVRNTGTFEAILVGTSDDVEITNCKVDGVFGHGISVEDSEDVRILNNQVTGAGDDGIHLESDDVLVSGNKVKLSDSANIRVEGSFNTIENNTLDSSQANSMHIGNGGGTPTLSNLVVGNKDTKAASKAIFLHAAPNTWVIDNSVTGTLADEGIEALAGSDNSVLQGNTLKNCVGSGIEFSSVGSAVLNNNISGCGARGILLQPGATGCYAFGNVIKTSGTVGFEVDADDCVLVKNAATGSGTSDLGGAGMNLVLIDNNFPVVL